MIFSAEGVPLKAQLSNVGVRRHAVCIDHAMGQADGGDFASDKRVKAIFDRDL